MNDGKSARRTPFNQASPRILAMERSSHEARRKRTCMPACAETCLIPANIHNDIRICGSKHIILCPNGIFECRKECGRKTVAGSSIAQ
jgi:hypothetical protein